MVSNRDDGARDEFGRVRRSRRLPGLLLLDLPAVPPNELVKDGWVYERKACPAQRLYVGPSAVYRLVPIAETDAFEGRCNAATTCIGQATRQDDDVLDPDIPF